MVRFLALAALAFLAACSGAKPPVSVPMKAAVVPSASCTCGTVCNCADQADCRKGACVSTNPYPLPKPVDATATADYASLVKRVTAGETVYVAIGKPAADVATHFDALADFKPGTYRCYKDKAGKLQMQHGHFEWQQGNCPLGKPCPAVRVWVDE